MGRTVILTEKPDVMRKYAEALGIKTRCKGFMQSLDGSMVVTHFVGHLLEFAPKELDDKYKKWDMGVLPLRFQTGESLQVKSNVREQFNIVKTLVKDGETDLVLCAYDCDAEGVLLMNEFLDYVGVKNKVKVIWTNDLTPDAIKKAMNNLITRKDVEGLYHRAICRQWLDFHTGINYTRALTTTNGTKLIFGRCVTPTLSAIVGRELEIEQFKPTRYYEVNALYEAGFTGNLVDKEGKVAKFDEAGGLGEGWEKIGVVKKCKSEKKKTTAPKLFSLQTLQGHMGKKYNLSPDTTLELCQKLYEKALLTYPRTDEDCILQSQWEDSQNYLDAVGSIPEFKEVVDGIVFDVNKKDKKYVVTTDKAGSHTALTPTSNKQMAAECAKLSKEEKMVMDEVIKRFLSIYMPAYEYKSTEIMVEAEDRQFISRGNVPVALGWKSLYQDDGTEVDELPVLQEGDSIEIKEFKVLDKMTKAPSRYTNGNILSGIFEKYNIGTPATRASFLPKLIKSGYIVEKKGTYYATDLGKAYIKALGQTPELIDLKLATSFEDRLKMVENGELSVEKFEEDLFNEQTSMIEKFRGMKKIEVRSGKGKCPICGRPIIENSKAYSCSGWKDGCSFTIWKTVAGKELSEKNIKDLLTKGKTAKIKGFKKKDGSGKFDAGLVLDEKGKIVFDFKA